MLSHSIRLLKKDFFQAGHCYQSLRCRRKRLTNTLLHVNGWHFAKFFIFTAGCCMYGRYMAAEFRSQGVQALWY